MTPPTITLANGQVISSKYYNTVNEGGGANSQYVFPTSVLGQKGAVLSFGGQKQTLDNSNYSYRGDSIGSLQASSKGAVGDGGIPAGFAPGQIGQFGFFPAQQSFPSPTFAQFNPTTTAPYNFTNPQDYAKEFGQFNRGEINKNYAQAKNLALDSLNTELSSLQNYTPAAAALKRNETSVDNQFNQSQRSAQIASTLPGVTDQLNSQADRAQSYANGKIPDAVANASLELGVRSAAADNSAAGGFGATSSVARKSSDLLSAEKRVQLSQYGDQSLSSNINQKAGLELASTEYSNAGSQINVNPPVSASQLISNNLNTINGLTTISPTTGLQSTTQQNQFTTGLEQATRQFNASGEFSASQFNANTDNQFKLGAFDYATNFAGAVAGAAQTNTNTTTAIDQQNAALAAYQKALGQSQSAQQTAAITQGIGSILTAGAALFGGSGSGGGSSGSIGTNPNAGIASSNGSGINIGGSNPGTDASGIPPFQLDTSSGGGGSESSGGSSGSSDSGGSSSAPFTLDTGSSGSSGGSDFTLGSSADVQSFADDTGINLRSAGVIPASSGVGNLSNFSSGVSAITSQSTGALNVAGLFSSPQPATQPVSTTSSGQTVHASLPLLQSNNSSAGSNFVNTMQGVVAPMGALSSTDHSRLATLSQSVSDPTTLATLDTHAASGDAKSFVNSALTATGLPAIKDASNPQNAASAYTAYQLSQNWGAMSPAQKSLGLAAMGMQGYQTDSGHSLVSKPVVAPVVAKDGTVVKPGLTVGQGIDLLQKGYNVYPLIKNWDQINAIQKVAGSTGDAISLASFAKSNNMLGFGPTGASVPNVTFQVLASAKAQAAPQFGVGAITTAPGAQLPQGYKAVTRVASGAAIAVPTPNANSVTPSFLPAGAGSNGISSTAQQLYSSWSAKPQSNGNAISNGQLGGSAAAAALSSMKLNNPYLNAGIIASDVLVNGVNKKTVTNTALGAGAAATGTGSYLAAGKTAYSDSQILGSSGQSDAAKAAEIRRNNENTAAGITTFGASSVLQGADQKYFGGKGEATRETLDKFNPQSRIQDFVNAKIIGATGGGKSDVQSSRDDVRSTFKNVGLADDSYQVTLADGTKADIGTDGHGGSHSVTNSQALSPDQQGKVKSLSSYDLDYTNDLDYAAGLGGITLSRLTNGKVSTGVDQVGSQLANASLKSVGFNQPLNPQTYATTMQNMRGFYAQAGIKSKGDGYQLANQAYSEGRLNETQLTSAHQSLDLVFDNNSFGAARNLMQGRQAGVQAASKLPPTTEPIVAQKTVIPVPRAAQQPLTKEAAIAKNKLKYQPVSIQNLSPTGVAA